MLLGEEEHKRVVKRGFNKCRINRVNVGLCFINWLSGVFFLYILEGKARFVHLNGFEPGLLCVCVCVCVCV